jgi:DNA-binding HxlR family transcriptional regulator
MDQGSLPQGAARVLSKRWTVPIMRALEAGDVRFLALQRALPGITHKVLIEHLRVLERRGIVARNSDGRSAVSYRLTERGVALLPIVDSLSRWDRAAG